MYQYYTKGGLWREEGMQLTLLLDSPNFIITLLFLDILPTHSTHCLLDFATTGFYL